MRSRKDSIRFKVMPDGNIRGYRNNKPDLPGVSEMQLTHPKNCAPSVITSGLMKIYIKKETI